MSDKCAKSSLNITSVSFTLILLLKKLQFRSDVDLPDDEVLQARGFQRSQTPELKETGECSLRRIMETRNYHIKSLYWLETRSLHPHQERTSTIITELWTVDLK